LRASPVSGIEIHRGGPAFITRSNRVALVRQPRSVRVQRRSHHPLSPGRIISISPAQTRLNSAPAGSAGVDEVEHQILQRPIAIPDVALLRVPESGEDESAFSILCGDFRDFLFDGWLVDIRTAARWEQEAKILINQGYFHSCFDELHKLLGVPFKKPLPRHFKGCWR
jgi:hypothetical protein